MTEASPLRLDDYVGALKWLLPEVPPGLKLLIWTLADKRSHWFDSVEEAAKFCLKPEPKHDCYFGCCLQDEKIIGPSTRGTAKTAGGAGCLWLDIDYASSVHTNPNLPPHEQAAMALIQSARLPQPTIITHTGHGLQAFWCFRELWIFDNDTEREEFAKLARGWGAAWQEHAKESGWQLDNLSDLARVMRMPGTINAKAEPVEVTIKSVDPDRFYNPSELAEFALEAKLSSVEYDDDLSIIISGDPEPPFRLWDALLKLEPLARQTWEMDRPDFAKDQSPSAYCMALANLAAKYNWTPQETTNLLAAFRLKHGAQQKPPRWYALTYKKAKAIYENNEAEKKAAEVIDDFSTIGETTEKLNPLEAASTLLGVKITAVNKYMTEPPSFELVTERGAVLLGKVEQMVEIRYFKRHLAATVGVIIKTPEASRWRQIAQLLLDAAVNIDTGEDGTDAGHARSIIKGYLTGAYGKPVIGHELAVSTKHPFIRDGEIHIWLDPLIKWLRVSQREKVGRKALGTLLRRIGIIPVQIYMGEKISGLRVWRVPADVAAPEIEEHNE